MAVTVEGTPTQTAGATVTSVTWSYTAGGDGLFVGGAMQRSSGAFSSCTFNGTSMTELWDVIDDLVAQIATGYLLIAPAAGAHNVVLTANGTADLLWGGAVGLSGLEQSSIGAAHRTIYSNNSAGGAGTGPTVTVVDSASGDLVVDSAVTLNATITVGTGQTSRAEDDAIAGGGSSGGVSTESATGGNTVMSWTGGSFWACGATALIAAAAAGRTTKNTRAWPLGTEIGMGWRMPA